MCHWMWTVCQQALFWKWSNWPSCHIWWIGHKNMLNHVVCVLHTLDCSLWSLTVWYEDTSHQHFNPSGSILFQLRDISGLTFAELRAQMRFLHCHHLESNIKSERLFRRRWLSLWTSAWSLLITRPKCCMTRSAIRNLPRICHRAWKHLTPPLLLSSQHRFKHFITDELRGNGFSNISLTPSLGKALLSGPSSRLEADGRSDGGKCLSISKLSQTLAS